MAVNGMLSSFLQAFDRYRAKRIAAYLSNPIAPKKRVLDCGCGKMVISQLLQQDLGVEVVGVDVISVNDTDLDMCLGDASTLPFADNSFDAVYAVSVLHHTTRASRVLQECLRVTKEHLVILEDVYQSQFELTLLKIFDWIGNRPVAAEMPLPFTFRSEAAWLQQFERLGAKVRRVTSIRPVPWRPTRHRMFVLETVES
jgi:ubiquinone/menaquinone biosynthesis C-methylase UbiE